MSALPARIARQSLSVAITERGFFLPSFAAKTPLPPRNREMTQGIFHATQDRHINEASKLTYHHLLLSIPCHAFIKPLSQSPIESPIRYYNADPGQTSYSIFVTYGACVCLHNPILCLILRGRQRFSQQGVL